MKIAHTLTQVFALIVMLMLITACVKNTSFRTISEPYDCKTPSHQHKCRDGRSIIESYEEFDLTFIEFTERGNLFNREHTNRVLKHISSLAQIEDGVAVLVFAHGWKHNANPNDKNVQDFKSFLSDFSKYQAFGNRRVVGLYLGWRGNSVTVPLIRELTYWDRKSVADEIGGGGATDILSRLHDILVTRYIKHNETKKLYKNVYIVIGHSFGSALVLSALDDVYINNLAAAQVPLKHNEIFSNCRKVERFADGVFLLNPAIEANKGMQIKELASNCTYPADQAKLLHILSSSADTATNIAFPIGQWLDLVLTANQNTLKRTVVDGQMKSRNIEISEYDLDIRTIGNYQNFRTGMFKSQSNDGEDWTYVDCRRDPKECGVDVKNFFPIHDNDPLSFIYTDGNFIEGHSDVFNCRVKSYISALVLESQTVDKGYGVDNRVQAMRSVDHNKERKGCGYKDFNLSDCFSSQLNLFCNHDKSDFQTN